MNSGSPAQSISHDRNLLQAQLKLPAEPHRVLPFLAVGPSFQYEIVTAVAACMSTNPTQAGLIGVSQCSNADSRQRVTAAKNYGVWSVGLELRLAL